MCLCASLHTHPCCAVDCSSVLSLFLALFLSVCLSCSLLFSSHFHLDPDLNLFLHVDNAKTINHGASANWGVWPRGRIHPSHRLWAQAPWRLPLLGDYWNLLPGAIQRHDALVLAWRGTQWRDHRQSALFTTVHSGVRRTGGPKASLSLFWSLLPAQSLSVCHARTVRPVHELSSLTSRSREKPSRDSENERIRTLLERQKRANSLWFLEQRFTNTSSKPILIGEVSRNWMELSSLNEGKLIMLFQEMNNFDEINNFFMNNYLNKIGIFVKLIWKVSMRWKNWIDFKGLHPMDFRQGNWSKIETLSLNSQARIQELQNEVNCWMIREI